MLCTQLEAAISSTLDLWGSTLKPSVRCETPRQWVVAYSGPFVARTTGAVLLLSRNGYSLQAVALARSVFEVSINVLYAELQESREVQYERFWDYRAHEAGKLIETATSLLEHVPADQIAADARTVRQKHGWHRSTRDWCDTAPNLRARAEWLGLQEEYDLAYQSACHVVHGTVFGMGKGTVRSESGDVVHVEGYAPTTRSQALIMVAACLPNHVQLWADVFDPSVSSHVAQGLDAIWGGILRGVVGRPEGDADP